MRREENAYADVGAVSPCEITSGKPMWRNCAEVYTERRAPDSEEGKPEKAVPDGELSTGLQE